MPTANGDWYRLRDDEIPPYRPAHNPEFVRAARERQAKIEAKKGEAARAAQREKNRIARDCHITSKKNMQASSIRYGTPIGPVLGSADPVGMDFNPAAMISNFCREHEIDRAVILGQSRKRIITLLRHQLYYEIKAQWPDLSTPQIGRIFGQDHTTALNAIQAHAYRNNLPRLVGGVPRIAYQAQRAGKRDT